VSRVTKERRRRITDLQALAVGVAGVVVTPGTLLAAQLPN